MQKKTKKINIYKPLSKRYPFWPVNWKLFHRFDREKKKGDGARFSHCRGPSHLADPWQRKRFAGVTLPRRAAQDPLLFRGHRALQYKGRLR
jgi:hypothetical protein